jgi:hypothetical protein
MSGTNMVNCASQKGWSLSSPITLDGVEMNIATHSLTTRDESFFLYNGLDSCVLPEIFSAQMQNLTTQRNTAHYERTRNLLDALMYASPRGEDGHGEDEEGVRCLS